MVVAILWRVGLGLLMSQLNENEEATILCFFVGIVFMVYLLASVPFRRAYQNYRSASAQLGVLAGLFVGMYYRSMKSTTSIETRTEIVGPAYCLVAALFLCLGVSLATLIYEIYRKCRCKKQISLV